MSDSGERKETAHRRLLFALCTLLVAFSVWCVGIWKEQAGLRTQLDGRLGALNALRELEDDLEGGRPTESPTGFLDVLDEAATTARDGDRIQLAAKQLEDALAEIGNSDSLSLDEDTAWAARKRALEVVNDLQTVLVADLGSLHAHLRDHWHSLVLLMVGCLILAASNLALLGLAHRRRRQLEEAHQEALELASHDHLTGLWNREEILRQLRRELERVRRSPTSLGLVLADLDDFQATNDFLGQDEGDRVLRQVAERFLSRLRPYDHVGRFGGDSFLFVLPTCDPEATRSVAERLQGSMESAVEHRLGQVDLSASFSWTALKGPRDVDPDRLLRRLHLRLEETQAEGPGRLSGDAED